MNPTTEPLVRSGNCTNIARKELRGTRHSNRIQIRGTSPWNSVHRNQHPSSVDNNLESGLESVDNLLEAGLATNLESGLASIDDPLEADLATKARDSAACKSSMGRS